jgi:hypothetical protein
LESIIQLWAQNREIFKQKSLLQIIQFAGEGKLRDSNKTSHEFRELINSVSSEILIHYSESCLIEKFDDSGFALQDIVNEVGLRLGFDVQFGLYQGRKNDIGYDGIWSSADCHDFIVEVKTSDAYRINLDKLIAYRDKLIDSERIKGTSSSILIIVGREDTGDLEAQIRGSKHAWDIRLMSTDSLLKLLKVKESFNDSKTAAQINEILKPKEYTKIDRLIDLMFNHSNAEKNNTPPEVKGSIKKIGERKIALPAAVKTGEKKPAGIKPKITLPVKTITNDTAPCVKSSSELMFIKEERTVTIIKAVSKIEKIVKEPSTENEQITSNCFIRFIRKTHSLSLAIKNLL